MLESPPSAELIAPRFHTSPTYDWTEGDLVAELIAGCWDDKGPFVLDPEQRLIVDESFAYVQTATGRALASFEQCIVAPRQNLKTGALKAIALGKIYISEQRLVVWTSHRATACAEAWRDLKRLIESDEDLLAEVVPGGFRSSAQNLSIEFTDDRRIVFMTRTADAAQTFAGDTVIIDEAYKLEADFIASLAPTLAARPEPQIIYGSSAGHLKSAALRGLRDRGRKGDHRFSYLEWSSTPRPCEMSDCGHELGAVGCFLDDEDAWLECNTAVRRGRITLDTLRGLRRTLSTPDPMKFGRELMVLWEDPAGGDLESPIDLDRLSDARNPRSKITGARVFALDVAPRKRHAAIVAAGETAGGQVHVEVPSRRGEAAYWRGTARVIPTFRRLAKRFPGATVRMLGKSQAAAFAVKLVELGFRVDLVQSEAWPAMCEGLAVAISDDRLVHLGDEGLLDAARAGVAVDVGENGQWRWGRRASGSDITRLICMTLAIDGIDRAPVSHYEEHGLEVV